MPSEGEVRATVVELVARLTRSDPATVAPTSRLKDLGIDSLLTVELADELGRRYDVYLSDAAVDAMRTVEDAVRSVVHHDGATAPRWAQVPDVGAAAPSVSPTATATAADGEALDADAFTRHDVPIDSQRFFSGAMSTALTMIVVGAIVGVAIGFGVSTVLDSAGLGSADLPPISTSPTADEDEETEATSTPTPSPTDQPSEDATPEPTLAASATTVPPGQRFTLSGAIPAVGAGAQLRVQVKDAGSDWDDFPVTLTTGTDGSFSAEVYTSRTGAREWRLIEPTTGQATPAVTVTIG